MVIHRKYHTCFQKLIDPNLAARLRQLFVAERTTKLKYRIAYVKQSSQFRFGFHVSYSSEMDGLFDFKGTRAQTYKKKSILKKPKMRYFSPLSP